LHQQLQRAAKAGSTSNLYYAARLQLKKVSVASGSSNGSNRNKAGTNGGVNKGQTRFRLVHCIAINS